MMCVKSISIIHKTGQHKGAVKNAYPFSEYTQKGSALIYGTLPFVACGVASGRRGRSPLHWRSSNLAGEAGCPRRHHLHHIRVSLRPRKRPSGGKHPEGFECLRFRNCGCCTRAVCCGTFHCRPGGTGHRGRCRDAPRTGRHRWQNGGEAPGVPRCRHLLRRTVL